MTMTKQNKLSLTSINCTESIRVGKWVCSFYV